MHPRRHPRRCWPTAYRRHRKGRKAAEPTHAKIRVLPTQRDIIKFGNKVRRRILHTRRTALFGRRGSQRVRFFASLLLIEAPTQPTLRRDARAGGRSATVAATFGRGRRRAEVFRPLATVQPSVCHVRRGRMAEVPQYSIRPRKSDKKRRAVSTLRKWSGGRPGRRR